MFLDVFEARWRDFHKGQMAQARVLVVDDEPNVGRFLQHALKASGYTVTVSPSVADAWPRIAIEGFDLIVVDKNMPEEDGLVLLQRLQESEHEIPTVLLTGEVSPEALGQALALGAADYLAKPIVNIEHLVRRLRSVLDRRLTSLFFDVMFSDLSKALLAGTGSSSKYTTISRSVVSLKEELGKRPACIVIEEDKSRRVSRVQALRSCGILAQGAGADEACELLRSPYPPLSALVCLDCEDAIELIHRLHQRAPQLNIVALADSASVRDALNAIDNGAADYALIRDEGMDICARRIGRLVEEARRHALYLGIATLLHSAAQETRPDLADDIIFKLPDQKTSVAG